MLSKHAKHVQRASRQPVEEDFKITEFDWLADHSMHKYIAAIEKLLPGGVRRRLDPAAGNPCGIPLHFQRKAAPPPIPMWDGERTQRPQAPQRPQRTQRPQRAQPRPAAAAARNRCWRSLRWQSRCERRRQARDGVRLTEADLAKAFFDQPRTRPFLRRSDPSCSDALS